MQFERLKKNHRKEILIGGMILVCVVSAITITTTRAKYKLTEDIKLASGTINYKPYDFKIMAMYQKNDSGTYSEITTMPTSGYVVNEEKSYCTTDNITQVKGKLYTNSNGEHVFKNLKKTDKCYIWFDKVKLPITIEEIIASSNPKSSAPSFNNSATTDEGVYKVEDEMYGNYSYYWRGAATTNYVSFAGFCWRIIRINGDKTMRLIYDGKTCHANGISTAENIAITSQAYNSNYDQSNYVGWTYSGTSQRTTGGTSSNAKNQVESWFNSNITGTNAEKVANGKFCNDRSVASGYNWALQPTSSFNYRSTEGPTLSCPTGDVYTLKIGLITLDEVKYAGVTWITNHAYYLYNGRNYWTMTPYQWSYVSSSNFGAYMYQVNYDGYTQVSKVSSSSNLRPVINLNSNVTFNAGSDGTQNNPYIVQ